MKKGAMIGMIVMLVLALSLAGAGFTGLGIEREDERKKPTEYESLLQECDSAIEESNGFLLVADQAIENIEGYLDGLKADKTAIEAVEKDASDVDAAIKKVTEALNTATKERENIAKRIGALEKIKDTDANDAAAIADARETKIGTSRNMARRSLTKITLLNSEEKESQASAETTARKEYEKAVQAVAEKYPDLELGDRFVANERDQIYSSKGDGESMTLRRFLKENWDYALWLAGIALIVAILCLIKMINPALLKKIGSTANKNMMLVALVVITLFFFVITRYRTLTPANIYNLINQYAYIIILATGMLLCIVSSANIDLSVGRVMGFIAACNAIFIMDSKMPVWLSMLLCLLIGIAIGAWQGFWIAYVKMPAFVVTLAGQLTFYGLTMVLLHGETKSPFPDGFNNVFANALPDLFSVRMKTSMGFSPDFNLTTMMIGDIAVIAFVVIKIVNRRNRVRKGYGADLLPVFLIKLISISAVLLWLMYSLASNKGLPTILITVALVLAIYSFITSKMVIGRHLYAMGGNVNAARLSGVKTQRMLFLTYVNMGFLAALAGLAYAARMNSASPMGGQGEELNAIAACYIGGASAYGGIGTVGGALIGALTMGVIKNGMSIMGMSMDLQQVVLGMVLLAAVVIDVVSKSNGAALPFLSKLGSHKKKSSVNTLQKK